MEHYFFESNSQKLFAVYHPPKPEKERNVGVLLCNPLHQEQIRCHKLYLTIANQLSNEGFHVLRFDYYGTGDSEGRKDQFTITKAIENVQSAINEFRDGCDLNKVVLFGVRFGATVSLLTAKQYKVDGIILWNPMISGKNYVTEKKEEYQKWLSGSFAKNKKIDQNALDIEGFIWSQELINEINQIKVQDEIASKAFILSNEDDVLRSHFRIEELQAVKFFQSTQNKFWTKSDGEDENTLVPKKELEVIQDWLKKNY